MKAEELKKLLQEGNVTRKKYEFEDETLVKTIEFVKVAHGQTVDKMGILYYTHPYRVCQLLKDRFGTSSLHTQKQINYACILALLHDVVEDIEYSSDDICKELGLDSVHAEELKYGLSFITHDKKELPYSFYIKKIAEADIIYPVWVKFCDLLDNSSLDRIIVTEGKFLTGEDMNRINKYLISIRVLNKRINCQNAVFKCDDEEIETINMFRTPAERKRFEKK